MQLLAAVYGNPELMVDSTGRTYAANVGNSLEEIIFGHTIG